jgi:hypothetical protein
MERLSRKESRSKTGIEARGLPVRLSCATPLLRRFLRLRGDWHRRTGVSVVEPDQDIVCGVLQTGVRLMQLARCLAGQLAQLVPVGHVRECPKN